MIISTSFLSVAQTIIVNESCSDGVATNYTLTKTVTNPDGRFVYSDGTRIMEFKNSQWEYTNTGTLSFTNSNQTLPNPPCSNQTAYTNQGHCSGTLALTVGCVLPIEFISIEFVKKSENSILVNFETGVESNITNFNVQKKVGSNFVTILEVKLNNKPSKYSNLIVDNFNSIEYFRIQTIENDGKVTNSKISSLEFKTENIQILNFNNKITISTNDNIEDVSIYNTIGKLILNTENTEIDLN